MTHFVLKDAEGIRSLKPVVERSDTTGFACDKKSCWHPGRGARSLVLSLSGGVVADAPQPPATGCDASGIVSIKICRL